LHGGGDDPKRRSDLDDLHSRSLGEPRGIDLSFEAVDVEAGQEFGQIEMPPPAKLLGQLATNLRDIGAAQPLVFEGIQ
jgi:hypothetical protein